MPKYLFRVKEEEKETRLDKFLVRKLSGFSRSLFQKLIKNSKILVSGKKVKPHYLLKTNDIVEAKIPPRESKELKPNPKIKPKALYQDKDVLVIEKFAGISVHPVKFSEKNTLVNGLIAGWPKIKRIGENPLRPGIVHRLDKDTSGLMIIAKNQKAFEFLKKEFQQKKVEKKYLALVIGTPAKEKGVIKLFLGRAKRHPLKIKALSPLFNWLSSKIKPAVSYYKIIQRFKHYTLLEVIPKTGRTHQIRVHLASIGFPIAGDKKYRKKYQHSPKGLKRQFLHSYYLKIKLPSGKIKELQSPLPPDLKQILRVLD